MRRVDGSEQRRWTPVKVALAALAGLVVLAAAGAAVVALTDVSVRGRLGAGEVTGCSAASARLRYPLTGRAATTWTAAADLPAAQDEVRAVALGDRIVLGSGLRPERGVVGGFASLDVLHSFDPATGRYERLAPLPLRVDHPAFAAHGGDLYVLGGWSDGVATGRSFRLRDGKWQELAPLPTPRAGAAAAVVGDRIVVLGGSTAKHDAGSLPGERTVEAYDVRSGRWSRLPDMPTARHHHAAAAVGDVITVAGGRDGDLFSLATVEQLDVPDRRWTEAAPLPLATGALTAAAVDGQVVVAGGGDDAGGWVTPAVWALRDGAWARLPDLRVARHGHGMAAVDGVLYVFGGAPCAGYGVTASAERLDVGAAARG